MRLINFDEIFSAPLEPPAIILVEGESGTLKSTLCFDLMLDVLKDPNKCGLYMTFEQTWKSHLSNMQSMGFDPPDRLYSVDYNIMRKEMGAEEIQVSIFNSILGMIESLDKEKKGCLKIFALDSLNAVYSIVNPDFLEVSLISFFTRLREYNMISLIINEKTCCEPQSQQRVRFLSDGIISLGILRNKGEAVRYLQTLKFAPGEHSLKRRHLVTNKDGISLLGPVYR